MEPPSEPAGEDQEQQISLFDPTQRYPVANPDLLEANQRHHWQDESQVTAVSAQIEGSASLQQLRAWYKSAQHLGKDERYLNRITELAGEVASGHQLPEKAQAVMEQDLALYRATQMKASRPVPFNPVPQQPPVTLEILRSWYAAARVLSKDAAYLHWITAIAQAFKHGKPLSTKELAAMQQDIQAYRQLK